MSKPVELYATSMCEHCAAVEIPLYTPMERLL